jgi:hypothetical protein
MQKKISENEIFEEIKKKANELEAVCMCGGSSPTEPLDLMKEIEKLVKEGNLLIFETERIPTDERLKEAGMIKIGSGGFQIPRIILPPGSKLISSTWDEERIRLPTGKIIKFMAPSGDAFLFGYFAF